MRTRLFDALASASHEQPELWLLSGDLGYGQIDAARDGLGERYLNVGVAEQNLVAVASGLALAGQRVVTYSIGPFGLLRAADQLRSGVVAHDLSVTVVCGGAGLGYGTLGYSHFALEDVAFARALGMTVRTPTTTAELDRAVSAVLRGSGPQYLRLERECCDGPIVSLDEIDETTALEPVDAVIVGYGAVVAEALAAREQLADRGIDTRVVSVPTMDETTAPKLAPVLRSAPVVVTVEEHSTHGGIGSTVASVIAHDGLRCRLGTLGTGRLVRECWGGVPHLRRAQGLDAAAITGAVASRVDRP